MTDTARATALYRRLAGSYDLTTAWLEPYRRRAVSELRLQPGDVVLDVGCGTGMSFEPIQAAIGPTGRLIGIEPCPQMLAAAQARAEAAGGAPGRRRAQVDGVRAPAQPAGVAGGPPVRDHLRGVPAALGRAGAGR